MPPLDAEAMAELREMPEPHAARVRGRGHLATEIWRRFNTGFDDACLVAELVGEPVADEHFDVRRHGLCVVAVAAAAPLAPVS